MRKYDVLIIGAATSGAYFARKMASMGYSVLAVDPCTPGTLGTRMDIFHVTQSDFRAFDIPAVHSGDPEWAFEFTDNHFSSPTEKYIVPVKAETVGLHMHEYTLLMVKLAREAGAEFTFETSFKRFIFDGGRIIGAVCESPDGEHYIYARTVVDCSGHRSAGRCALPAGYGVENDPLGKDDFLYVILRYVRFASPQINTFRLNTKSWFAPFSMNPDEKIIGTGAAGSFESCEKAIARHDRYAVTVPYETVKTEKGVTPYRRPPYSLTADSFIVTGDAACLTKPDCGEGVTSSMVMMDIAAEELDAAFKKDDTSLRSLWNINRRYNRAQGADFALVRAFMTKLVNTITDEEIEYCFSKRLIFNEKFLNGEKLSAADLVRTVCGVLGAFAGKGVSRRTFAAAAGGAALGFRLRQLYINFPASPDGFYMWTKKADALWSKVGKVKEEV